MGVILIALGAFSAAYGLSVMLVWSGSPFFVVWFAVAAVLVNVGIAVRRGTWPNLPIPLRAGIEFLALLFVAISVAVGGVILMDSGDPVPDDLDVVLVLGAQVRSDGTPGTALRHRLDTACDYLRRHPGARCVVSGGQGANEPRTEAECMRDYLVGQGIASSRVSLEGASRSTVENLVNSRDLIGDEEEVGIVTSDFHVFRALRIAKAQGYEHAHGISAPSSAWYLPNNLLREAMCVTKDLIASNM